MKKYLLKINPEALSDIRDIANWYDEQKAGEKKLADYSLLLRLKLGIYLPQKTA